jgi:HD-GYP domain-containing protein (c-di-GMP phosphodiesterase class II)
MKTLCEQAVIAIKNAQLYMEQEKLTIGAIKSIAAILETKAPGTLLPRDSFLRIVHLMGQELKMSEHELKSLQYATLLHDAGQIALPDEVVKKKGLLTGKEYKLIKEHPKKAAIILKPLKSLKSVVPIILHHHESYDGTGYPSGLKGPHIPLGARIMGVVGAFEAMITKKYRKPLSIQEAINEIKKNSGIQFDPKVVEAFLKIIKRKDMLNLLKKEIYATKKTHK